MNNAPFLIFVAILVLLVGYVFQLWARHQRRLMIHRERLAALERGIELPPLVEEIQRGSWNVQRLLLLAGLCWISVGVALFMTLDELSAGPPLQIPWGVDAGGVSWFELRVRPAVRPLALAPIGIGIAHIIVYFVGRRREG